MTMSKFQFQLMHWAPDGSNVDFYKDKEGSWHPLPCFDNPKEAVTALARLGIKGGVLRHRKGSPNATGGWHWTTPGGGA